MSFSTGCRKCMKCGKMYLISLFDDGLCAECEKAEQEPTDKSNLEKICEELAAENDDLRDQLAMRDRFKQEPCDDAVSRQAVLDLFDGMGVHETIDISILCAIIKNLPSVRPQEQTGHWILQPSNKEQGERDFIWWKCSECGQVIFSETEKDRREYHAFCGRCGAKMVEPTCDTCEYNTAAFMPCNACEDKSEYKLQESEYKA